MTRPGYTFAGWYSDAACTQKWDFDADVVADNVTLYGRWLSGKIGITEVSVDHVAGTINGTEINVVLPYGTAKPTDSEKVSIALTEGQVSKPVTADNGETWVFTVTSEDGMTTETYTIKVSNAPQNQVTITFETNGGSSIADVKAGIGTIVDLSNYKPVRANWEFNGWYLDPELTNPVTKMELSSDKTIYAGWTEKRTDSNENGNTGTDSGTSGTRKERSDSDTDDSGSWVLDGKNWRYRYNGNYVTGRLGQDENGSRAEYLAKRYIDGAWWLFGADGFMKVGWTLGGSSNDWYHVKENTGMTMGWHLEPQDGLWYYLSPRTGVRLTGSLLMENGII